MVLVHLVKVTLVVMFHQLTLVMMPVVAVAVLVELVVTVGLQVVTAVTVVLEGEENVALAAQIGGEVLAAAAHITAR